jgi:putative MATE family efflux protein
MSRLKKMYSQLKESMSSDHRDFTQGDLSDAVILLAIPMILELSLESVFAVVDMFFVAKLGSNAIATVGLTESVITIIYSIAIGISTGATAVVARRVGEKNPEAAAKAGAQSLVFSIILSVIIGFAGAYWSEEILAFMGASPEVISEGAIFTRIMLGGSVVILLLFLINGIFRGAGDAAMAMKSLWLASGVNIILCPIFIHFWGLKGAAIATLLGRTAGVIYQCYHLNRGSGLVKLHARDFKPDFAIIGSIVKIAWPASLQFIIGSGSWIVLTRLVAETGGTVSSAGYQIAFRNFVFFFLPAWGLSNVAATLVGQNLGAQLPERAEESVKLVNKYTAYLMGAVTVLCVVFAGPIVGLFTHDAEVAARGTEALRIIGAGYIFYGIAMVMSQALNGAGDTKTPTRLNVLCFWVFQIPFAYFLAKGLNLNALGAILSLPVSQALFAAIAWWYFKKGNWKTVKV